MHEPELNQQPREPMGQRFISLAMQGHTAAWRSIAALTMIGFLWLFVGSMPFLALGAAAGMLGTGTGDIDSRTGMIAGAPPLWNYIGINLSLVVLLIAVCVVVPAMHNRPVHTLLTTRRRISWRRFAQGFGLFFFLAAVDALVHWRVNPADFAANVDMARFLVFLPFAILFTPLQSAAEELLFRGYLLQVLGRALRSPVAGAVVAGVLFAVPHFLNPEMASGAVAMALNYIVMGLFMGLLVLRDNRIELAIGVHAGSNFFLAVFMTYPDAALDTPALFATTRFDPISSLVSFSIMAAVYWLLQFQVVDRLISPPDEDEAPPEALPAGEAAEEPPTSLQDPPTEEPHLQ